MAQLTKTALEMDRIRKAAAVLEEKARKAFVPEPNIDKPVCYIEIGRYVQGSCRGLFTVYEFTPGKGKKDAERKRIAEGVGIDVVVSSIETAVRRRVFK